MITWDNFYLFALPAIVLWGAGAVFALFSKGRSRWAIGLTLSGILVFAAFITGFWLSLQRPPLRTMVFVLYGYIRLADLSSLEVSLDIVFFHCSRCGICDNQYSETGNS